VQGPSGQETPLQVACLFEYVEGDITTPPALPAALNGMLHLAGPSFFAETSAAARDLLGKR
jgi:hypothetical protein